MLKQAFGTVPSGRLAADCYPPDLRGTAIAIGRRASGPTGRRATAPSNKRRRDQGKNAKTRHSGLAARVRLFTARRVTGRIGPPKESRQCAVLAVDFDLGFSVKHFSERTR